MGTWCGPSQSANSGLPVAVDQPPSCVPSTPHRFVDPNLFRVRSPQRSAMDAPLGLGVSGGASPGQPLGRLPDTHRTPEPRMNGRG
jgi:hypothetical protein